MENLDQQRAKYAWETARFDSEFKNLAKGAPALIMGNGLMPTLAYLNQKGKSAQDLLNHILYWLCTCKSVPLNAPSYPQAMQALLEMDAKSYLITTDEALSLLRWTRQFAGSVKEG